MSATVPFPVLMQRSHHPLLASKSKVNLPVDFLRQNSRYHWQLPRRLRVTLKYVSSVS
jgi:hypothetical protein